MKTVRESIICAGFGGQGIMTLGKVFATCGMDLGLFVTWFPSYGAEVRGGTAHAMVQMSSEPIASPVVYVADTLVIMNGPSLNKFEKKLTPGGLLILNTSLVTHKAMRSDIDIFNAPLTDEAIKLGNVRVANMIAAGIHVAKKGILDKKTMLHVIETMASGRKEIIPINIKALERGIELVKENS